MTARRSSRLAAMTPSAVVTALLLVLVPACRSDSESAAAPLTAAQRNGLHIVLSSGCTSCHGAAGVGGVGPGWAGLYGSTVQFDDGTSGTADEAYLTESIKSPAAKRPKGSTIVMPPNRLTDAQIADVVAYITTLHK